MHFVITEQEYALLTTETSCEELMLYMLLKRFADFKTGVFSHPSTKKVNLSFLAGLMTRDARQGKAEKKYAHIEVRRFLDRLVDLGLVADLAREGVRTLTMRLPFVGSDAAAREKSSGNPVQNTPKSAAIGGSRPVGGNTVIATGSPCVDAPKNARLSGNPRETVPRLSGAKADTSPAIRTAQAFQGTSAAAFITKNKSSLLSSGRASERMNSPSAPQNQPQPHHAASRLAEKPERNPIPPTPSPKLDADIAPYAEFLREVSGKALLYPYSERSLAIYRGWKMKRYDLRDIDEAFRRVIDSGWMKLTADSVETALCDIRKPATRAPVRSGRICL